MFDKEMFYIFPSHLTHCLLPCSLILLLLGRLLPCFSCSSSSSSSPSSFSASSFSLSFSSSPLQGIKTLKFVLRPEDLYNSTLNPANAAYYMNGPSGLFDTSRCEGGTPVRLLSSPTLAAALPLTPFLSVQVSISLPYFLQGSNYLREDVHFKSGTADESKHELFVNIEPVSRI